MSTAHKIAITAVVLFVALSTAPAAVTAVDFPSNDDDWQKEFSGNDDVSAGTYEPIETVYVDATGEEQILFRAVLDEGELDNNGLQGSNDALQIYIDTGGDDGISSDTEWGSTTNFFDGLDAMNADYRVTAKESSAVVEEHEDDIFFNTIGSFDETADNAYKLKDNSGTNDDIMFALDRDTIDNPESLDVKFAYIEGSVGAAEIDDDKFNWAPSSSVRLGAGEDGSEVGETATVTTEVEFGDEPVDDDATVDIVLTDDNGNEAGVAEDIDPNGGTLSPTFTVNPANFNGEGGEFSVEVTGDDAYTFERDVDNTESIDDITGDTTTTTTLGISTLTAEVKLGSVRPLASDASVEVTLTDTDGTETPPRVIEEISSDTLTETFTVNPANFDSDAELTVEVVGDESVPYTKTKTADVSSGNRRTVDFTATGVEHEFTLSPQNSNPTISGDTDTFTLDVSLESSGSGIHTVDHQIDFDDANLVDEGDGIDDISINNGISNAVVEDVGIEADGTVRVVVISRDGNPLVTSGGGSKKLYDISFEYEDGLRSELPKDDNAIEFAPSTSDATKVFDGDDDTLRFASSTSTVEVENNLNRITSAEVTHLSENANMAGFKSFRYEVAVETNDAEIDAIRLNGDAVTGGTNVEKTCDNEDDSVCTVTFEQTPSDDTLSSGTYSTDQLDITAVMASDDNLQINAQNEGIESDELNVTVLQTGDFAGTGDEDEVEPGDITRGVENYLGDEAAGETWSAAERGAASYDVNGDREVGITDITAIIDKRLASP